MFETITTRANHLVDPHLHVWAWQIPLYLFLGGWVAGLLILFGLKLRRGARPARDSVTYPLPWIGLGLLSLGMLALFLDLEHKLHALRLYVSFEPSSPMSWGAWILLIVYPVLVLGALLDPPGALTRRFPWLTRAARSIRWTPDRLRLLGLVAIACGILLGVYTGVLLSSLGARPFWSSGLLAPLFLVSGLSAGAAFAHLIARRSDEQRQMVLLDTRLLAVELALLLLLVLGLVGGGAVQKEAAALVLRGPLTAIFWVLVVGVGVVLPLVVQLLAIRGRVHHQPVAPLLVLGGGLALRFVIVWAGQASHWLHG
ncbi:MAG: polysulfide reductase NrfD [Candidatus Eisenbacteria bacterium]|nr:polysulfide reductase NrfD [Candidatus Eisenbacteria bacterium]